MSDKLAKIEEEKLDFLSHVKGLEFDTVKNILKVSYLIQSKRPYWISDMPMAASFLFK